MLALHPLAELCVGMARSSVLDNFRVVPPAEHVHAGYLNSGELVVCVLQPLLNLAQNVMSVFLRVTCRGQAFGLPVEGKRPKIRVPDRVGVLIDFMEERMIFFHNGHPVGSVQSQHIRGRFHPCITCVNKFEVFST